MPCTMAGAAYDAVVSPAATCGGGFVAPKFRSYDVAPAPAHDSVSAVEGTPETPLEGDADVGAVGAGITIASGPAETLSNDAAFSCVASWLVTTRAPSGDAPKVTLVEPTCDHDTPSTEKYPV